MAITLLSPAGTMDWPEFARVMLLASPAPQATTIPIAAKTGTAQNGVNNSHLDDAVFTSFAPADNPQIAVGVIVKGGGFGADAAAPIALKIIQAYLGQR